MSDISELEQRLEDALDRIASAVRTPPAPAGDAAEVQRLTAELAARTEESAALQGTLEEEQLYGQQMKARNDALHAKADAQAEEIARLKADLGARDSLTAQLRRVNEQLRQNNLMLRNANAQGLGDPHLINRAMVTELEAIRASRDAERAEIDAVLAELRPLIADHQGDVSNA